MNANSRLTELQLERQHVSTRAAQADAMMQRRSQMERQNERISLNRLIQAARDLMPAYDEDTDAEYQAYRAQLEEANARIAELDAEIAEAKEKRGNAPIVL